MTNMWKEFRSSMKATFASLDKTLAGMEKDFEGLEDLPADEKITLVKETLPDGTVRTTKTIVRNVKK